MQIGLEETEIREIVDCAKSFASIQHLYLFGSRAVLNHKLASDVDICIRGEHLSSTTVSRLRYVLNEETNLPYFFDIIDYGSITSQELLDHIDEFGVDLLAL